MADHLDDSHRRIADLAAPDGAYAVVDADTGERPVPLKGKSFPSPDAAEAALDLAREYRAALREWGSNLPERRLTACETTGDLPSLDRSEDETERRRRAGPKRRAARRSRRAARPKGFVTLDGDGDEEWLRIAGAPLVRIRRDGKPVDDDAVARQLRSASRRLRSNR